MRKALIDITMPSLGSDMRDGQLIEWQVAEGDRVSKGDIIAVIETNKGAIDMECYHTGIIAKILAQPVVSLPVGTVMAKLEVDSDTLETKEADNHLPQSAITPSAEPKQQIIQPALSTETSSKVQQRQVASPVVRKLAKEKQWDLSTIRGSGPDGAILLRDIPGDIESPSPRQEAEPVSKPTTAPASAKPPIASPMQRSRNLQAMRKAISSAMEKSKREIPHYYLSLDIDLTRAIQWLRDENAQRDPDDRILLLALLLKAGALTLTQFPELNGFYQQNRFEASQSIHIGNAISLRDGGLVIPAIHDVDKLSLNATMQALRDVTSRSRTGHLRSSELTDATITITSIGDRGSDSVFGVIYPPQVAIIGVGRLRQAAIVKNNQIIIGDTITVTLSADHRVSDGILGAKFLHALSSRLQKPESL